jgi:integrase
MTARVENYLHYRRALGYVLRAEGHELRRFARYADEVGHRGPLTVRLALNWARLPSKASPMYRARRLEIVRCFAKHQFVLDPKTEIPPRNIFGPTHGRKAAYIYSEGQITDLLAAAGRYKRLAGLGPQTYQTLFGLLACTGLRISEALHLTRQDVDLQRGILIIRQSKFQKSRLVPLHPSVVKALRRYSQLRDRTYWRSSCSAFFLQPHDKPLRCPTVQHIFRRIRRSLGWHAGPSGRAPRIHDLRHTFASRRLLEWYRENANVPHLMIALSTYLGHVKVSNTYWYLTGIPELLSIAATRFEQSTKSKQGERP